MDDTPEEVKAYEIETVVDAGPPLPSKVSYINEGEAYSAAAEVEFTAEEEEVKETQTLQVEAKPRGMKKTNSRFDLNKEEGPNEEQETTLYRPEFS